MSDQIIELGEEEKQALSLIAQFSMGERQKTISGRLQKVYRIWVSGKAKISPDEAIDNLVEKGMVSRTETNWICLTELGKKFIKKLGLT
ncbi:MAG: hypothetical protein ACUVXA_05780 [Candidatus Jordarchaeum sp.]|uniref:hypothetical protein n=1 Tax=Candidatus Jordarchaeum sp. TaxID=2823881 RepID=UPI00404B36DB